jgi:hypothetical protein
VWTFANAVAMLVATYVITIPGGWRPVLTAVLLAPAITFEIKASNVHGFMLASLVLASPSSSSAFGHGPVQW